MELRNLACCGIKELNGVSQHDDAPHVLREMARYIYTPQSETERSHYQFNAQIYMRGSDRFRYVIFSQANAKGHLRNGLKYGENLAAAIRRFKLGTVVRTEPINASVPINPNSGNYLQAWIWTVDHAAFKKWFKKQEPKANINEELNP